MARSWIWSGGGSVSTLAGMVPSTAMRRTVVKSQAVDSSAQYRFGTGAASGGCPSEPPVPPSPPLNVTSFNPIRPEQPASAMRSANNGNRGIVDLRDLIAWLEAARDGDAGTAVMSERDDSRGRLLALTRRGEEHDRTGDDRRATGDDERGRCRGVRMSIANQLLASVVV